MPTKNQHLKKADLNKRFGDQTLSGDQEFRPWSAVIYFYGALHWVDAYLAHKLDFHPANHVIRTSCLSKETVLQEIYEQYWQLRTDSDQVRYTAIAITPKQLKEGRDFLKLIEEHIAGHI